MAISLSDLINERKNKVSSANPYEVSAMMANLSPDAMAQGFAAQQANGNPFQVDSSNYLGDRASQIYNKRLGNVKSSILRNAVFADAERDARTSQVIDATHELEQKKMLLEKERQAQKKAKKKGLMSAVGGVAGGVGAGLLSAGNPYAIQAGMGAGSMLGGM